MSASLAPECNEAKESVKLERLLTTNTHRRYDSCFIKWYSESQFSFHLRFFLTSAEFLRGTADTDECAQLFKVYNKCLFKALKAKGIDSMVEEARKEAQETDAEHMQSPVRCEHSFESEMKTLTLAE
jgi:hypothetical protein